MRAKTRRYVEVRIPVEGLPGENTHIEVSVFYGEGGMNYFTYTTEPRAFWASVKPVKVREGAVSFLLMGGNGFKVKLREVPRFNAKVLAELSAAVLSKAPEVATAFAAGKRDETAELLRVAA